MKKIVTMTVLITCPQCGSGIDVYPSVQAEKAKCDICEQFVDVTFSKLHEEGIIEDCPLCGRKDFYSQKDFNRKIGVLLFILAAVLSIYTYGVSFIILYLFDLFLFKKLRTVVVCYNCNTIMSGAKNSMHVRPFNHEMHDRIVYSGHDFGGKTLEH